MSWLSDRLGINVRLSPIVPGASATTIRKTLEALKLDVPTLRIVARVAGELAAEKEVQS